MCLFKPQNLHLTLKGPKLNAAELFSPYSNQLNNNFNHPIRLIFLLVFLFSCNVYAKSVALVIGNANYSSPTLSSLNNPEQDAKDVATALTKIGFEVFLKLNLSKQEMDEAINQFRQSLQKDDIAFFYYSGHGVQAEEEGNFFNYLLPTDISFTSESELRYKAVSANYVLDSIQESGASVNVLILDACRDVPPYPIQDAKSASRPVGLARMSTGGGSLVAFATQAGKIALDGPSNGNSPYVKHLKEFLIKPDLHLAEIFNQVRIAVSKETNGMQQPEEIISLSDNVYLYNSDNSEPVPEIPIEVTTEPSGAKVFLNGIETGYTPFESSVPPSQYTIRLELQGYQSLEESVAVSQSKNFGITPSTKLHYILEVEQVSQSNTASTIDELNALIESGESTINLLPGEYIFSSEISINQNLTLIGAGENRTILKTGEENIDVLLYIFENATLTVQNLTIEADNALSGIISGNYSNVELQSVTIRQGLIGAYIAGNSHLTTEDTKISETIVGIMFMHDSQGIVNNSVITNNRYGVSISDNSIPHITSSNNINSNQCYGVDVTSKSASPRIDKFQGGRQAQNVKRPEGTFPDLREMFDPRQVFICEGSLFAGYKPIMSRIQEIQQE